MARVSNGGLLIEKKAKAAAEIKSVRANTKRGEFVRQLFSKEGVTSESSILGKLWIGVADEIGYGIRSESKGGTKDEKTGELVGGTVTWFGVLPEGLKEPKLVDAEAQKAARKAASDAKRAEKKAAKKEAGEKSPAKTAGKAPEPKAKPKAA